MMPLFYNISYKDLTTGHFKFLQTRVTISNTSCEVFPGDSVPVGFCIDYLIESVISDTFEISFIHTSVKNYILFYPC